MWIIYAFDQHSLLELLQSSKIGIKNIDSHLATAIRTIVILIFSWLMVFIVDSFHTITNITFHTLLFLILSGSATGLSWLCYFKALQLGNVNKVTPIDKSSTILTMILAMIFLKKVSLYLKSYLLFLLGLAHSL